MRTNADGLSLIEVLKSEYEPVESRTNVEKTLTLLVRRRLTSNQFSALVSLGVNIGLDDLKRIIRKLNKIEIPAQIADEFDKYVYGTAENGDRILDPFLIKQRELERSLYTNPELVKKRGKK